jgi:hypothetical protein
MQGMSRTEQHGLCSTCNNRPTCVYRAKRGFDALYCEMYDDFMLSDNGDHKQRELPVSTADVGPAQVEFTGLCANCDNRHTCTITKPEGGIWHCEEYS